MGPGTDASARSLLPSSLCLQKSDGDKEEQERERQGEKRKVGGAREPQILDSVVPQEPARLCSPVPINSAPILSERCEHGETAASQVGGTERWEAESRDVGVTERGERKPPSRGCGTA